MKLNAWRDIPAPLRAHLLDRLRDRQITVDDLNILRIWIESEPEVPEDDWFKDFGRSKICGTGPNPATFLTRDQVAWGFELRSESE